MKSISTSLGLFLLSLLVAVQAQPTRPPGAPTATLWYQAGESVVFYNEVKVLRSAPSSYFSVCGWQSGYFGIQELANGEKVVIFSVWDSDNDDPAGIPESERTKAVKVGRSVRIGRFGNEGSGGQSFLDYEWKNEVSYSFLVTAEKKNKRIEYSAFFRAPEMENWVFIATFSTQYSPKTLDAMYSFIEDFERTPASQQRKREAIFSNGWAQAANAMPKALSTAQLAADRKTTLVDVVPVGTGFRVAIGGGTKLSKPLESYLDWIQVPGDPPANFPKE